MTKGKHAAPRRRRGPVALVVAALLAAGSPLLAPDSDASVPPAGQTGSLDSGFGNAGIVDINVPGLNLRSLTHTVVWHDPAAKQDKIIAAGLQPGLAGSVTVVRLNSTGALDSGFGTGGIVRTGLGSSQPDAQAQIALQPDGKVLVVGDITDANDTDLVVTRLNTDGSTDTAFGTNGRVVKQTPGSKLRATGVAVQPDGKIVVSASAGASTNFVVLRYSPSGVPDTGFGVNGVAAPSTANSDVSAADLTLQPDGKIIVVGSAKIGGGYDTAVTRFLANGAIDVNFPNVSKSNGTVTTNLGGGSVADGANAVTVKSGAIIVSGTIAKTPTQFVMRLTMDGLPDNGFGTKGVLAGTFGASTATGYGLAVDHNGKTLVVGGDGSTNLGIERLGDTGTAPYDSSFGLTSTPGRESVPCDSSGAGAGVTEQPDGKIVATGNCGAALRIVRLSLTTLGNLTLTTSTTTAAAGEQIVPLDRIPASLLARNAELISSSDLRISRLFGEGPVGSGYTHGGYTHGGYTHGGYTHGGYTHGGYTHGGYTHGGYTHGGYTHGGYTHGPYASPLLGKLTLAEIPLIPPFSWAGVLVGTSCADQPLGSLTTAYVMANCDSPAVEAINLGDIEINSTPLRNVSLIAFALGLTPASALPSVCAAITGQKADCTTNPPTSTTLLDYELLGDNLDAYYKTASINLMGLALADSPLSVMPLTFINLGITALGQVKATDLADPAAFVTCGTNCPAGFTLADAQNQKTDTDPSIVDTATLAQLLSALSGKLATLDLYALLAATIPPDAIGVEALPFRDLRITSPLPATGSAQYSLGFDADCGVINSVDVAPALPTDFRILPSSVTMKVGTTAIPLQTTPAGAPTPHFAFHADATELTASQPIACTGKQHVTIGFSADPTAELVTGQTADVTVRAGGESLTVTGQAPVTTVDPTTAKRATTATPDCTPITANTAYVDRISTADNVDQFCLTNLPANSSVVVTLSHLPALTNTDGSTNPSDLDLVAFGNGPASLRGQPYAPAPYGDRSTLVTDTQLLPNSDGTITPPELVDDIPMIPNVPILDASLHRGRTDEALYIHPSDLTGGTVRIQVSGFNLHAPFSTSPYLLTVTTDGGEPGVVTCDLPSYPAASGTLPTAPLANGLTTLPAGTTSLFLVDQTRLASIYGADQAATVVSKVNSLLHNGAGTDHDIAGQIVYVDAIPAVRQAYADWAAAADKCAPEYRQRVVTAINQYIDSVRGAATGLRFVTIVGGDEVIPYALVPDRAALANEATFGPELRVRNGTDNSLSRAMSTGYIPSDNPYCDLAPVAFGATPLYTPQLACGRLVESPSDIIAAIDGYVSSGGVRSPNASLAAGYDWMLRTAQDEDAIVGPGVPAGSRTTVLNQTWTRQQIKDAIASAAHGFLTIDAHSNWDGSLAANDFTQQNPNPDIFTPGDLPADLSNSVMFTVGCHLGLSVADTYVADPAVTGDWAQGIAARNGLLAAGQTGYGIGDTDVQAYSARLLAMFAQQLNGTVSVGQALQLAKQRYLTLGVASVYDAKAIHEATYYGLPQYRLGASGTWGPATLPAGAGSNGTNQATSTVTFTQQPFTRVDEANGSYYRVGNQPVLTVPGQPVQPQVVLPVTKPAGAGSNSTPRDAIIEDLSSADTTQFDPLITGLRVSGGIGSPAEPQVQVTDFPSRLQSVVNGQVVLVPGQFLSAGNGTGTQRLFTDVKLTVNWCDTADHERPMISSVDSWISGGVSHFVVTTPSTDVTRGVINFLAVASNGVRQWTHVEMVKDSQGNWVGTSALPDANTTIIGQYFVQLSDGCNVGVSSNKAHNYATGSFQRKVDILLPTPDPLNGLYPPNRLSADTTQATIVPADGLTVTWTETNTSVPSAPVQTGTCPTQCTVTISGDGKHILEVRDPLELLAEAAVPIDKNGPAITLDASGWAGHTFQQGQTVPTGFNPATSCSGVMTVVVCTGPVNLDTTTECTDPAHPCTATFTAVDEFGITTTRTFNYYVDATGPSITLSAQDGTGATINPDGTTSTLSKSATVTFSATDVTSPIGYAAVLDSSAAPTSFTATSPVTFGSLAAGTHTVTVWARDGVGNLSRRSITWTVRAPIATTLSTGNAVQRTGTLPAVLTTATGQPLANKPVYFYVLNANGSIQWLSCGVKTATNPPTPAYTDATGKALCAYTPSKPVSNAKSYYAEFNLGPYYPNNAPDPAYQGSMSKGTFNS